MRPETTSASPRHSAGRSSALRDQAYETMREMPNARTGSSVASRIRSLLTAFVLPVAPHIESKPLLHAVPSPLIGHWTFRQLLEGSSSISGETGWFPEVVLIARVDMSAQRFVAHSGVIGRFRTSFGGTCLANRFCLPNPLYLCVRGATQLFFSTRDSASSSWEVLCIS